MGRVIRADVRQAGHRIWQKASHRVHLKCGDEAEAAWLMESAVEQISRYLDRKKHPLFSTDVRWLLLTAFCRLLRRYTNKLGRLRLVGDLSNIPEPNSQGEWCNRADGRVELTKLLRRLSPKGCKILELRIDGFGWREIAGKLDVSESAIKHSFWREIRKVQISACLDTETKRAAHSILLLVH